MPPVPDGSRIHAHDAARQVTIEMIQDFEFLELRVRPGNADREMRFRDQAIELPRVVRLERPPQGGGKADRIIKTDRGAAFEAQQRPACQFRWVVGPPRRRLHRCREIAVRRLVVIARLLAQESRLK